VAAVTTPRPIIQYLRDRANTHPEKPAIISGGETITYGDLLARSLAAAAWLKSRGARTQRAVLLAADSRNPAFAPLYFGLHLCRSIVVPVDARISDEETGRLATRVEADLVLRGDTMEESRRVLEAASVDDAGEFDSPPPDDIAEIVFTTGSTGRPKGVTLSHANIAASAALMREFIGNTGHDREVVTVPLTHSFGLGRLRSNILAGGTAIFVPGLTFPQMTFAALEEHAATGLACVPAGMEILLSRGAERLAGHAEQLRYVEMGSAPMRRETKLQLCRVLPHARLCMHYGLTEASRSTFIEFHEDAGHLDSVGRPSPGVSLRIRTEQGTPADVGVNGMIQVRAPTVTVGYWRDEERTRASLAPDGWFNTGDLGWIDGDGYLHLSGRADDTINTGGEKIMPTAIEDLAMSFPGVHDCGCVGIPDPDELLGQIPLLCVVPSDESLDLAALRDHLLAELAGRIPALRIETLGRLPKSESGKLLRRKLPEMTG